MIGAERIGDMDFKSRLLVLRQEDGDIIVKVIQAEPFFSTAEVEFCTIAHGGGRSPETFDALLELIEAMERDNKERPQNFLKSPKSPRQ